VIKVMKPKLSTMDTRTVRPPPKKVDEELRDPQHLKWRARVLARADYRCEFVDPATGKRCEVRSPETLFADHIIERQDGGELYSVENGQCLCGSHHSLKTIAARAARMHERF
jgi:5-methylcytosine-specific restriction protein A